MGTNSDPENERVHRFNPLTGKASKPNATEYAFLMSLPAAKYSRVSEFFRKATSGDNQCKFFCGGKKCKYENGETHWTEEQMAIKGLYSTWITDNIMAIARPNTINILKYDMIGQFKRFGIKTIINLQKPGEHPYCGHGLVEGAGFSYDPQLFMDNGIFHYNFGWDDYGVTTISTLLDMVRVFQFATEEGNVAVHCHAGLGRTGVLITCFLVYHWRISANRAIQQMRMNRPQAVQTRQQMACVRSFAAFLRPLQVIFPHQQKSYPYEFTLTQFLRRQRYLLHGFEARYLHHIPKLIFIVGDRIIQLVGASRDSPLKTKPAPSDMETLIPRAFQGSRNQNRKKRLTDDEDDDEKDDDELTSKSPGFDGIVALNNEDGAGGMLVPQSASLAVSPPSSVFEAKHEFRQIKSGRSSPDMKFAEAPRFGPEVKSMRSVSQLSQNCNAPADDSAALKASKSSKFFGFEADAKSLGGAGNSDSKHRPRSGERLQATRPKTASSSSKNFNKLAVSNSASAVALNWEDVAEALIKMCRVVRGNGDRADGEDTSVSDALRKSARISKKLNECDSYWAAIENETDPLVLSALLWTWIDQLKEPILTRQDLNNIVAFASKPVEKILRKLDRGTRETIKHLISIFAFMETGKSKKPANERNPPSVPIQRLQLLLLLAEQLCHQDFTQPIREFMEEAMLATALEQYAELSTTFSSTYGSSALYPGNQASSRPKDGRRIPTFDRSDAVVVVIFVYRLYLFVARTQDLITDFDGETTYEAVMAQLFHLVEKRTAR